MKMIPFQSTLQRFALGLLALGLTTTGCSRSPTAIRVVLHADPTVTTQTRSLRIQVFDPPVEITPKFNQRFEWDSLRSFPFEFNIVPTAPGRPMRIDVDAFRDTSTPMQFVRARAITSALEGRVLRLDLYLYDACTDPLVECQLNETCRLQGRCENANVDPTTLPNYGTDASTPQDVASNNDVPSNNDVATDTHDAGTTTDASDVVDVPVTDSGGCPTGTVLCGSVCANRETDNQNCGGCGNVCPTGSSCARATCICAAAGQNACSRTSCMPDSLTACGASCTQCQSLATWMNATAACTSSQCTFACNRGFGNCDRDDSNACETPLNTAANCGMCGPCPTGQVCCGSSCAPPGGC